MRRVTAQWVKLYWIVVRPLAPSSCAFTGKDMPMCILSLPWAEQHVLHCEEAQCWKLKAFSYRLLHIKWAVCCLTATAAAMTSASPRQLLQCQRDKRCLWIQEPQLCLAPCHVFSGDLSVIIGWLFKGEIQFHVRQVFLLFSFIFTPS